MSLNDLDIRHLRAVVAVAEAGGFSAAARDGGLPQTSLSRIVALAERAAGVTLFERTTRYVGLTPAGLEFVHLAKGVLAEYDSALRHFDGYQRGSAGEVTVAALPSVAAILLPPMISNFSATYPHVWVRIHDVLTAEVPEQVLSGRTDMAISEYSPALRDLDQEPLIRDKFVCIFSSDHPFANAETLQWTDLHKEPFVQFNLETGIRGHVERERARAGVTFGPISHARNVSAVAGLVSAGLGISIVPSLVLPLIRFVELQARPILDFKEERTICLGRDPRRPLSLGARRFIDLLRDEQSGLPSLPVGAHWVRDG